MLNTPSLSLANTSLSLYCQGHFVFMYGDCRKKQPDGTLTTIYVLQCLERAGLTSWQVGQGTPGWNILQS